MSDATEYRANAEAAARLASQSEDGTYKATMLKIAQAWLEMADRHTVLRASVIELRRAMKILKREGIFSSNGRSLIQPRVRPTCPWLEPCSPGHPAGIASR
jgi:hypothetical protein